MLSAPPATATSVSPSRMYCDAETMACMPLPHSRLTVNAPVSCGRPPFTHARREMYMSLGSVWMTLPMTHWPTSFGSTLARATASFTTRAARSLGAMSFRLPP